MCSFRSRFYHGIEHAYASLAACDCGSRVLMADAQQMTMRALEAMVALARERGDGAQSDMAYLLDGGMVSAAAVVEYVESLLVITSARATGRAGASRRRRERVAAPKCTAWTRRSGWP